MPVYEVELDDGRTVEIEGDRQPTHDEVYGLLKDYKPTPKEPEFQSGLIAPKERKFSMYDVPSLVDKLSQSPLPTYGMDVPTESVPVALAKTVAGLGRGVVSPLGAAATALGPVEAAGPALRTGFGALGAKGLADIAAQQITTPEARPKTLPQAVELAGQVLPQLAMAAAPFADVLTTKPKGAADALKERIEPEGGQPEHIGTTPLGVSPEAGGGNRPVPEAPVQAQEVVAATYTNPETGQTTTAPNHIEAAAKQGVEAPQDRSARETKDYGFEVQDKATGQTEVVSRDDAEKVARESGQLLKEPEGKKIHSDEIESPTEPGVPLSESKAPPPVIEGEAQPTVPAAGKAEGGVSAPPAPAIPEGGISPAKVQVGEQVGKLPLFEQWVERARSKFPSAGTPDWKADWLKENRMARWSHSKGEPTRAPIKGLTTLYNYTGEVQFAGERIPYEFLSGVKDIKKKASAAAWHAIERRYYERTKSTSEGLRGGAGGEPQESVPSPTVRGVEVGRGELARREQEKSPLTPAESTRLKSLTEKMESGKPLTSGEQKRYRALKDKVSPPEGEKGEVTAAPVVKPPDVPERPLAKKLLKPEFWELIDSARKEYDLTERTYSPESDYFKGQKMVLGTAIQNRLSAGTQAVIKVVQDIVSKKPNWFEEIAAGHKISGSKITDAGIPNSVMMNLGYEKVGRYWERPPTTPPSTGEGMVGMGGAVPSEFETSPQTPTSIKNATVDVERAKRGLPPVVQPARRAFGEVWDRAMAMIDRDPSSQDHLIDSLRQKPRALTDVEDAMLLHRQIDLQNEYGKATRDLAQAYDDGRTDAVAEEKLRVARLSDDLLDLYNIGKKVGTETARGLNARKMMANEDFTLAKMTLESRLANNGQPLSDARLKEIQELHDKINATQKAYDDYVASTNERLAKLEIDKVLAEQKAAAPRFDKRILDQAEKIVQGMEKFAEPAAKRLKERLAALGTSPDPAIIYDAAVVGSARIARLGLDLAKLTDSMVSDFGEKIRPFMAQIWAESNKMLDQVTAKAPEAVRKAVKKADLSEVKTNVADNIADKVKKGQKDKITTQVHILARALVKSGITDREALIDAVHDVLKDVVPGITRRESMDAISGYGDFKQLSKDQISVTLRGMKGEMQQLAKLEDMAKGQPPLKSGMERRTPTEAERRLIKEVNDAKNKFQVPVQDPSTQLKSALDTLKTTLKNRIADYQERIAKGDYAKRPRREIVLDPTAQRLKAENERVKKIFQRGVALERLKNAEPIERAGDWMVKWRRGFILSSVKTLGKLTTAALQRAAITPAEEVVGGVIGKVIPEVAKRAPREGGFNVTAEAKAISQGITQGMEDASKTLRTGQSDLDILYGKEALLPPSAVDFFGHVHGALKAPVKRAEFARSLEKRTQHAIASGVDLSDPLVQSRLVIDSYKDANRAIFQQDNRVVTAYKRALQALEAKDKATGQVPIGGKIASTTARLLLPIVKVPTNIVAETMQYATGSVTGSINLARAFRSGVENLHPDQADLIMRQFKKGSLGAAVLILGYLNPEVIGGYYQPGEKRPKGAPRPGTIQLYGVNIPSWALHNPLIETLQIGATVRRVADSKLRKKDTVNQGVPAGIAAGIIGLGEEVPFVREMGEVTKAFNPHERGAFFGELGKSMMIPQFVQQTAQWTDPLKETPYAKRKPQTVVEHVKMGIPGLREEVPVRAVRP